MLTMMVADAILPMIGIMSVSDETVMQLSLPSPSAANFFLLALGLGILLFVIMLLPMFLGLRLWLFIALKHQTYDDLLEELRCNISEEAPVIRLIKNFGGQE